MKRYSWFIAGAVGLASVGHYFLPASSRPEATGAEAAKDDQLVRLYVRILGTSG